jgi:hypothetical protein
MTTVSDAPLLPPTYAILSESGAVSELILKDPRIGLPQFLKSESPGLKYFDSLVVSDFSSREKPDDKSVDFPFFVCSYQRPLNSVLFLP